MLHPDSLVQTCLAPSLIRGCMPIFHHLLCIDWDDISKYKKNRVYPTYALVDPALLKSDLFQLNSVCSNSKQICYVLSTDVSLFSELDYFHLLSDFLLPKCCHPHRISQMIILMDHSIGADTFPILKLRMAWSISSSVLSEIVSGVTNSRGSNIMQPFSYSRTL